MRPRWILLAALVLLAASAVAGVAQPRLGRAADPAPKKTITVTGTGKVTTVPDQASFDFTVETRAETAKGALARNATDVAAVIKALGDAGVAKADIQTSQVTLMPQTDEQGTRVLGYTASNTVTAKTTIASAGALVDAAVGAGADGVSGPMLSRSDQDAQYREALKRAVADAKAKAVALAEAGGMTLGEAQTIVEGSQVTPMPFAVAKAADAASSTPIEPGTQTIEATVTVTYGAS